MMKKVPKRRFKGFLNAGDWEQRKLGECIDSFEYGLNAAAMEYDGKHKYIRITDIDDETHAFIQDNLTSPAVDFNGSTSNYRLKMGDIVFARTGASVGKTYLYNPNDGELYYAGFLIKGAVNEDCDAGFIYQNTLIKEYDSFIKITSQRSGQPGVNSKEYASFKLNIPSKCEQEKISSLLSVLDNLVTLHQRKLEKLQATKKALLYELFPIENSRRPKLRFKGFTGDWEQRKLSDILRVNSGKDYKHLDQGNIPVYGTGGYMLSVNESLSNIDAIGIGRKGTIDKPQYLKAPFWTVDTLFYLTALGKHSILFLYYLMQLIPWKKFDESTGVPSLSKTTIDSISAYVPSNSKEEELISTLFNQLDKSITLHQRKLEKLKNLKAAYLNEMFV